MTRRTSALTVLAALLLVACSGGDGNVITYTDPTEQALVHIPVGWNIYEIGDLPSLDRLPFVESVEEFQLPPISTFAFDGAPARDVANINEDLAGANYPIGVATIRNIGTAERDLISRSFLVQSILPYGDFDSSQEIFKEDFSFGNGYDGVRVLVGYQDGANPNVGIAYIISVTDDDDSRMYSILAGCSQDCFQENQETIEGLVDSWLVNTRG